MALEEAIANEIYSELGSENQGAERDRADRKLADAIADYIMGAHHDPVTQMRWLREAIERAEAGVADYVDPEP